MTGSFWNFGFQFSGAFLVIMGGAFGWQMHSVIERIVDQRVRKRERERDRDLDPA